MKRLLQQIWNGWKRVGMFLGDVVARVVLTVFYFTILVPFGVAARIMAARQAGREPTDRFWVERNYPTDNIVTAKRQF